MRPPYWGLGHQDDGWTRRPVRQLGRPKQLRDGMAALRTPLACDIFENGEGKETACTIRADRYHNTVVFTLEGKTRVMSATTRRDSVDGKQDKLSSLWNINMRGIDEQVQVPSEQCKH